MAICLASVMAATYCSWRRNGGCSSLQAHLAPIKRPSDVETVMAALLSNSKIQRATHNMMAYRIWCFSQTFLSIRMANPDAFSPICGHCGL